MRNKAYHFELDPNNKTRSRLASHCGAARVAYNTMLAYVEYLHDRRRWERRVYGESRTLIPYDFYTLRRIWNNEVKEWAAPWWRENNKEAYNTGLANLAQAFENFWDSKNGRRKGPAMGWPRYKKKSKQNGYKITTGRYGVVDGRHVRLPVVGIIRTKESTAKLSRKLNSGQARLGAAKVARRGDRWYVSFDVAMDITDPTPRPGPVIGVDLGVKHLATLSTGETVVRPPGLALYERRLRRYQRQMSRRKPGSGRQRQAQKLYRRTHQRVVNIRKDATHKLTSKLVASGGVIVIEDLSVRGMVARGHGRGGRGKAGLNRAVLDCGFGLVRRQLEYKSMWVGSRLVVADRWYPSSKRCSGCGLVKAKLALSVRVFVCDGCGLVVDRDVNAARNLAKLGYVLNRTASGVGTDQGVPGNSAGRG